jgi:adenylate cyclase
MAELSKAVDLAWQAAADEALQSGARSVEPSHLMIGTCSVEKVVSSSDASLSDQEREEIAGECSDWSEALAEARLSPLELRRALRGGLPSSSGTAQDAVGKGISRSTASRAVFENAEELVRSTSRPRVRLIHLAAALLECVEPISAVIRKLRGDPDLLQVAVKRRITTEKARSDLVEAAAELPRVEIAEVRDGSSAPFSVNSQSPVEARAALLYELPLRFGQGGAPCEILQESVRRLATVMPGATHAVLLVKDPASGKLLLEAHVPAGTPAVSLTLAQQVLETRQALLWIRGEAGPAASHNRLGIQSGIYAPLLWQGRSLGVISIASVDPSRKLDAEDLRLVTAVAHHAAMAIATREFQDELQRKTDLLERLMTNFSPRVRNLLVDRASHGRLRLGGEKSEVTLLNSDIRGFTQLSAGLSADAVVDLLNDYFAVLVDAIFYYDGTVDKFIGDGILAVFGSPEPDSNQHEKALRAALAMQQGMRERNEARRRAGQVVCDIGIGVHCGEVLHGFIGTRDRMEFTVIGDAVNRTSRYCNAAKPGEVLFSKDLQKHVWRLVEGDAVTISTKHEGDLDAYRLKNFRE